MNEKPKSFWRKSRSVPPRFRRCLIGLVAGFPTAFVVMVFFDFPRPWNELDALMFVVFVSLAMATSIVCLLPSLKWLFHWQNLRRVLFLLACLATLIALFYAEEDWRGWHAWSRFRQQWEAKGEHFDFASAVPPPVPDDQNFAFAPVVFTSYGWLLDRNGHRLQPPNTNVINRMMMDYGGEAKQPPETTGDWTRGIKSDMSAWQQFYRRLAAKTNLFPVPLQPQSPAADVLLALSPFAPTIEDLRQAASRPYSRFPLNYDAADPASILLPHLAGVKSSGLVLRLRVPAELQSGRSDLALADLQLLQRLADSVRDEPFMISHLVRISLVKMMVQPVWEGLADHRWTEPQLAELDAGLTRMDFLADYKSGMEGEMALQGGIIHYLREHPGEYSQMFDDNRSAEMPALESTVTSLMRWHLAPNGWFYQNQLFCARAMEKYFMGVVDLQLRTCAPAVARQGDDYLEDQRRHLSPYNIIECQILPPFGSAARKFAFAQSTADLARVAIALERFRLAHGKFPDSLDALAPQFLNPVPLDVIGGKPLHYRLAEDGQFVLYSVGWNEKDDGGVVALRKGATPPVQDISQGDWVWSYRQP